MRKKFENLGTWMMWFVLFAALIVVYKTFDNFNSILGFFGTLLSAASPFIAGAILAYILNLPIKKIGGYLSNRKNIFISRHSFGIAIIISYILLIILVSIIAGTIIPALYNNLYDLYKNSGTYLKQLESFAANNEILKKYDVLQNISSFDLSGELFKVLNRIDGAQMQKYAAGIFSATSGLVNVLISLFASVYMILEKKRIIEVGKRLIRLISKEEYVDDVMGYCYKVNEVFTGYVYSRVICCIVMGIVCSIVLSLMGVKYALVLGIFIGVCDLIPYFGSIVATALTVLLTMITSGFLSSVWVAVVLIVLQQLDGNLLAPKVMGMKLEISPLLTVFSVVIGGKLFGTLGMLFAVPVVAVIRGALREITKYFENKKRLKAEEAKNNKEDA